MIAVRTQLTARDLPADRRAATGGDRGGGAALGGPLQHARSAATAPPRGSPTWSTGPGRASTPTGTRRNWRLQLGIARLGQPLHRDQRWTSRTGSGCSCTPGSRGVGNKIAQHHIEVAQRAVPQRRIDAARPRPGLPGRGHRGVRGVPARPALGPALRAAQPRGDDGPRRRPASRQWVGPRSSAARRSTATTTTPQRERHFGKDVWLSRKGAIDAADGRARAHPGHHGHARPTSWSARATPWR